jgi:hypothetical protein
MSAVKEVWFADAQTHLIATALHISVLKQHECAVRVSKDVDDARHAGHLLPPPYIPEPFRCDDLDATVYKGVAKAKAICSYWPQRAMHYDCGAVDNSAE